LKIQRRSKLRQFLPKNKIQTKRPNKRVKINRGF